MNGVATIHANFISDLQQLRSEINNILDSLENEAIKEAMTARDSDQKTVNSIATACDSMLSDIRRKTSELEELNKYKQKRQLVISSKRTMKTVNTYRNRVNDLSNQNRTRDYRFQPDEEVCRFLHSLYKLGHMKERKDDERTQVCSSAIKGSDIPIFTSHHPAATHEGNIDVRHSTDKDACFITGGLVIDQARLALVDYNNYSVKIANLDRKTVMSCIELPTRPYDITCVNQDRIVVTCNDSNNGKLVFLKVGPSLSKVKTIKIDKHCQGIVYTNNTFFVTFNRPESSVKAIDMNGNVLKTLKTFKDGSALFSNPEYICLSTDRQTVFVSDWSNHTVTSLVLDGTVRHVYTEDSLKRPYGLAVDRNDTVYIAGHLSHNIHQLSTEGNQMQVILDHTDGVMYPWMVTYCETRHRLYIVVKKGSDCIVSVYQLH